VVWEGRSREASPYPDQWRKAVIGQNANVSKVPNSEHVLVGKDVSCTGWKS
jgi:hypothetical protein